MKSLKPGHHIAKILHFRTHHLWNSTTELILVSIVRGRKQRKETFALSGCHFHANPEQLFMQQCCRKIAFLDVERDSSKNNKNNISTYLVAVCIEIFLLFLYVYLFGVIDTTLGKATKTHHTICYMYFTVWSFIKLWWMCNGVSEVHFCTTERPQLFVFEAATYSTCRLRSKKAIL